MFAKPRMRRLSYCTTCRKTYDPLLQLERHPHYPLSPQDTQKVVAELRKGRPT